MTTPPEGTSCDNPFFDAEAINLLFVCRKESETVLITQGVDGLLPVPTTIQPLLAASLGRDSETLILENGTGIYLSSIDGTVSPPLIELSDLRVRGG